MAEAGLARSEWKQGWRSRLLVSFVLLLAPLLVLVVGIATGTVIATVVAAVLGLAALAFVWVFPSGLKVVVDDDGVERTSRGKSKRIRWQDLDRYELAVVDKAVQAGAMGGAIGALVVALAAGQKPIKPSGLVLTATDGTKIQMTTSLDRFSELVDRLVPELVDRLFVKAHAAFDRGDVVQFGKKLSVQRGVGISLKGLFGKAELSFQELGSITVERAALVIRRKDGNAKWKAVAISALVNPGVFERLAVAEKALREPGPPHLAWTV
ncbi:MAG TPA: DUF6585 family protein [Polyangiaceae bacterium]|jgi:hypothetical protein|nr:DUF6585 family protein [Polyangiaceae bacterium]